MPEVYGDPALLLPLVYNPEVEQESIVGYIPHYVDKKLLPPLQEDEILIDVQQDWKKTVRDIKRCSMIISSSLHGIVAAEAYGIPAVWVSYSDKIIGGDLKFQDYFLGTDRGEQAKNGPLDPIPDLEAIQQRLIKALQPLL